MTIAYNAVYGKAHCVHAEAQHRRIRRSEHLCPAVKASNVAPHGGGRSPSDPGLPWSCRGCWEATSKAFGSADFPPELVKAVAGSLCIVARNDPEPVALSARLYGRPTPIFVPLDLDFIHRSAGRTRIMAQLPSELLELGFDPLNSNELVVMTQIPQKSSAVGIGHFRKPATRPSPISLGILVYPSDEELTNPPPSMEAAFRTLCSIMHLVARLAVPCTAPAISRYCIRGMRLCMASRYFAGSAPHFLRDPDIVGDLPIAFPSLVELEAWYCDFLSRRSPLSLSLKHLHITEVEQSDVSVALSVFDTSTIPRISVATRDELDDMSKEIPVGISNSGLHLSLLRRTIGPSREITSFTPQRLARLTIAHRLLKHFLKVAVELPQLEILTISLRSFTVDESVFYNRKRVVLLDKPALKLLVLHDGDDLAPDRKPKGTYPVVIKSFELTGLVEYMGIAPRDLALHLCGVKLYFRPSKHNVSPTSTEK
ncbi:hypothetical protein BKA62DRAFT_676286 [Auriculariales sp. MPI-PUGE-AT-0066]|nr:hypothetical protein BKA62DRAFT_676286 [Auriculariales sp. MPI-PUGE-AT-0066]